MCGEIKKMLIWYRYVQSNMSNMVGCVFVCMVDRSDVEEKVRDGLRSEQAGEHYIIKTTYDGIQHMEKGLTTEIAVQRLVERLWKREHEL